MLNRISERFHMNLRPEFSSVNLDNTFRLLNKDMTKVIRHYQANPYRIPKDHILFKLLSLISDDIYKDTSPLEVYYSTLSSLDTIGVGINMTTDSLGGEVFEPSFYVGCKHEIYISQNYLLGEEDFDASLNLKDWESRKSVRVISHPYTDVSLSPPALRANRKTDEYAVFVFDIPMLAAQYHSWTISNFKKPETARETTAQFIVKHVLVNMIEDQMDIAILNFLTDQLTVKKQILETAHTLPISTTFEPRLLETELLSILLDQKDNNLSVFDLMGSLALTADKKLIDYIDNVAEYEVDISYKEMWGWILGIRPILKFLKAYNKDTTDKEWNTFHALYVTELKTIKATNITAVAPTAKVKELVNNVFDSLLTK